MYQEYFDQRLKKINYFDKIRMHKLVQISQYNILYVIVALTLGSIVNYFFPDLDEKKSYSEILQEVLFHSALLGIAIFYTRKIVKLFPYILSFDVDYIPYKSEYSMPQFNGYIIIALVFVTSQMKLLKKMRYLAQQNNHVLTNFFESINNVYNNIFDNKDQKKEEKKNENKIDIKTNNHNLVRLEENQNIKNIFNPNSALNSTKGLTNMTPKSSNSQSLNNIPFNSKNNVEIYQKINNNMANKKELFDLNNTNNSNQPIKENAVNQQSNIFSSPILFPNNEQNNLQAFSNDGNFSYLGKINQNLPNISRTLDYSEILKNSY